MPKISQVSPKDRYAWTDRLGITQPDFTGSGASAQATITASVISTTMVSGGSGYTSAPTVSWTGSGTGLALSAEVSDGQVVAVNVVSGGSLFQASPSLSFSGGGGTGASFTCDMGPYSVTSVTPTSPGKDYYDVPQITLEGGGGTGAVYHAVLAPLSHTIFAYVPMSQGTGYTSAPAVIVQNIPMVLTGIIPLPTADAGNLVVAIDSSVAGATVTLAVALWDERGNPISIVFNTITTSAWATDAAGNYIAESPYNLGPAYLEYDVSLGAGYRIFVMQISRGAVNLHAKLF